MNIKSIGDVPMKPEKKGPNHRYVTRLKLTGNEIVDRVQMAIHFHQANYNSLRTVSLKPRMYDKYWEYFNNLHVKAGKGEIPQEQILTMFDVDIKRGSILQKDDMYFEGYFQSHEQKDGFFGGRIRKKYEL